MKILLALLFVLPLIGQETFTEKEVIQILEDRDEQWKSKLEKAENLIHGKNDDLMESEHLINALEEQAKIDSLLLIAKDSQIKLLKARDEMNEKMIKLVKPKWYQNTYIWLLLGLIIGKL